MPAIIAPQPLAPAIELKPSKHPRLLTPTLNPIYRMQDCLSVTRLRSPIPVSDPCLVRSAASTPKPSCSSLRRRSKPGSHSLRRRRPLSRVECRVESAPAPHIFDQLPWISALDSTPEQLSPWDLADLSQIPDRTTSGPGPVRRRKTLLRSSPLRASDDDVPTDPSWVVSSLPFRETPLRLSSPDALHTTPRSLFNPSRVLFQNLMPVSLDQFDCFQPRDCITTPFEL
ncbi:hypothetical protein BDQ12DRAFT_663113 [Crucibulum laeve]|uniref:Uncharacterized protein n=1 Tax=Crucibulum laeve TaxID=68775 RepID=A0A5C3MGI3_9AGAR|nr:hypothetical protein BDQ12DRAFT_663113 [Crucibulum laeve]